MTDTKSTRSFGIVVSKNLKGSMWKTGLSMATWWHAVPYGRRITRPINWPLEAWSSIWKRGSQRLHFNSGGRRWQTQKVQEPLAYSYQKCKRFHVEDGSFYGHFVAHSSIWKTDNYTNQLTTWGHAVPYGREVSSDFTLIVVFADVRHKKYHSIFAFSV